jgi:hypothetical protein
MNGGTPAVLNISISMIAANHGLRRFSPLKSSSRSASNPARDSSRIMPKEPTTMMT